METNKDLLCRYPELDCNSLSTQLAMFRSQTKYSDVSSAVQVMNEMSTVSAS